MVMKFRKGCDRHIRMRPVTADRERTRRPNGLLATGILPGYVPFNTPAPVIINSKEVS